MVRFRRSRKTIRPKFLAWTPVVKTRVGLSYYYQFKASGTSPITFGVSMGALPPGLSLDPTTGVLSGTPTTEGSYSFIVRATNIAGHVDTPTITIVVAPTPVAPTWVDDSPATDGVVGTAYSYDFNADGTPSPTYTVI